ncbi:uncharacterized protein MELLADRAFT_92865 [Melampsora larici-populina 98AG31]|uniref:ZIP zinc/iron transport family n=1 Tax=Melampsora larici-populina (strain 98AG31 / pathotype 3-4-7) TaxID=747676 RepID=F4S322_MELLP|nr:uncharacterized protein MELLADRAFT_92865 [Melampsora larici-populina 98AG31]EGG00902.1 hypothetical protein MELLADRAFT_92865 [Melampsora larici-populina 98AG31]
MAAVENSTSTPLDQPECGSSNEFSGRLGLRVGAIFIILVTSLFGTLFPILTRRSSLFVIPAAAYEFAKYFGSGVIIATAFIHLLAPANEALSSDCLTGAWKVYPWPEAISMISVFVLFLVEIIAFRVGTARLTRLGVRYHTHGSGDPGHADHSHTIGAGGDLRPEHGGDDSGQSVLGKVSDEDPAAVTAAQASATAQLISVAILEIGVVFHSAVIGLTLAVDPQFTTFFIVIIFHQMFEGLGLGSRLSQLRLPARLRWLPVSSGMVYSFVTPLGLAIGLGVRNTYRPDSPTALMVSGTLDAFSSGVLLYTGLVELLAHDFIFNREMLIESSNGKMAFAIGSVLSGAAIMALLGRWA